MKKIKILVGLLLLTMIGCSTSDKVEEEVHENLKRNYEVRDASSKVRPGWIQKPMTWATQKEMDVKKYRFFSFETSPNADKDIACNLAKANVRVDIAGEISAFINKKLTSKEAGDTFIDENDPQKKEILHFVSNVLVEKIKSQVTGAAIVETYWEKRQYLESLGAKRDFVSYTCASFVRMEEDLIRRAVEDARSEVINHAKESGDSKEIEKTLENAPDEFESPKFGA